MNIEEARQKIAKLINLSTNQASTADEAETAMRFAEALMRKFNLTRAEIVDSGNQVRYEWEAAFYGFGRKGRPTMKIPEWFGWLAVAIANFTDTIASSTSTANEGAGIKYKGEAQDVILAMWFLDYLKENIRRATREVQMGSSRAREQFRRAMALRLCARLKSLREERTTVTSGTALVVVNEKLTQRDAVFGQPNYGKSKNVTISDSRALVEGVKAADKVNLNRPLGSNEEHERVSQ